MRTKIFPLLFACALCAALTLGFESGKTAFTKRYQTGLLKDPQPLAESIATLPFATGVKISDLQGKWANVSAGTNTGWIYLGNLAEEKPSEDHGIAGLQTSASATTASVAARPLDNVTSQYADQEGLGAAEADVKWLESQSDKIGKETVVGFLKTNKKGEFQ
ncbi:MAG TPA: hypothetical protein VHX90_03700 [Verrucomicrobiae bacterium]|jgi:hypothetical protein|nr:hypothetical protein [Verrucomicrobiae bacterium]